MIQFWRRSGTTPPTTSTIPCSTGDVVLVPFHFADKNQWKRRPAVIVSASQYHSTRPDAVMVALTSAHVNNIEWGDCALFDQGVAGLPKPTKAKGVVRTIEQSLVIKKMGTLSAADMYRLKVSLRYILDLP
jgi:mRNA interferase MazF